MRHKEVKRRTMAPRVPGVEIKIVNVTEITDRDSAITEDRDGGIEIEVPLLPQRAKGGLPQVGEVWALDRSLGRWVFSYVLVPTGAHNTPFEVVEALPAASEDRRGQVVLLAADPGVADTLQICLKSAGDTYSWKVLQTG
jgi:hypothetical protein